jgi:uncharacterized protein YcbK (DUF882 family)
MIKTLPERTMAPADWAALDYFSPGEKWGDPDGMDYALLRGLERLRKFTGKKITIHCGKEPRTRGWHPTGRAADLHIEGLTLMEQWLAAARFSVFTGLGVYTWWHRPGLHLDTRPLAHQGPIARWGSTGPGVYVPLDTAFIRIAMAVPLPGAAVA